MRKEIKILPTDCAQFSMELLDKLRDLQYKIIDEHVKPGDDSNWLCGICCIADCAARKAMYFGLKKA